MSVKKTAVYMLGAVTALAMGWAANLIWFKPFSFDHFQSRVIIEDALTRPQILSTLRILEQYGLTGHNAKLDDISPAQGARNIARAKENLDILRSYHDVGLTDEQLFNKTLMAYSLQQTIGGARFQYHDYPITQLYGWHNRVSSFLTNSHSVFNIEDAEHYIARLEALPGQFNQLMAQLKIREEKGIIPPTFMLDKSIAQMEAFVKDDPKESALYVALQGKLDALDISAPDKTALLSETEYAISEIVHPIWAELIAYVTTLKEMSTTDDGVWKLPDGDIYYQNQLEQFTTTLMTADEIHNLGLSEVARIQNQMMSLFEAEGFDTSKSFTGLIKELADDPQHYYPDTDEGRAQILADYTAMIDEIGEGISDQFFYVPKAAVEVVRVPSFIEQGAPGGYYNQPALDGSRPGQFYANLYDIKGTPKYGMRALTYHEAVPGHHYQIALQMEKEDLPLFRRFSFYNAYVEGWALYAERVAMEMGYQKTNFDKIGAYQSELFRAVRLVVDTGIHAKRWTREEAIKYMADNTGMAMSDVVTEIERYIAWPGQATSYKIGQLTILRLRDEAKAALGDGFDIREFHDLVLGNGAVPLTILEDQVKSYVESKR